MAVVCNWTDMIESGVEASVTKDVKKLGKKNKSLKMYVATNFIVHITG